MTWEMSFSSVLYAWYALETKKRLKKKLSRRTYDAEVGKEEVVYRDTPATKSSLFYFAVELY